MKNAVRFLLVISQLTFLPTAQAKELVSSFEMMQTEAFSRYTTGNEFMAGQEPGTVMMKVNLWGAVRKPGIHHIPVKSDLISLMSYAGGPSDNAIMDEIVIKRNQGKKQTKLTVDLTKVIHGDNNYDLTLQPEDIIVVGAKKPAVSQDTFMIAALASIIASTVLSVYIINEKE